MKDQALGKPAPPGDTGPINHATTPKPLPSNTTQQKHSTGINFDAKSRLNGLAGLENLLPGTGACEARSGVAVGAAHPWKCGADTDAEPD